MSTRRLSSHQFLALFILSLLNLTSQQDANKWNFACDSLICDPPKVCIVQDQVAQCLLTSTNSENGSELPLSSTTTQIPTLPTFPPFLPPQTKETATTPSPFGPLLNLFGSPTPFALPGFETTTPTTSVPQNICELPPLTGPCSRARIMWYFDTETGKCERFSYSGCGNANRFESKLQCEQRCLPKLV